MTQDEIIRMAREAGFTDHEYAAGVFECSSEELEHFAALVAAHAAADEREACAKVCEQDEFQIYETAERCAAAIRSRSNEH